ncbi:MAG: nitroreductase family protein [Rubrobacteridae bacterium]|nr:nitroreductase family protein [Rubrobacteridae bacterium]
MEANSRNNVDFHEVVKSRRSVRYYDSTFKIPTEEIKEIIKEATLAPSGHNLQPWRFLIIDNQDLKQKLLPIAFGQQQAMDASAIIFVLADKNALTHENMEKIYSKAVEAGYMTDANKKEMIDMFDNFYKTMDEQAFIDILIIDSSLVSMQLMLAAKARGYDTVPMAGYDVEEFRKTFSIPDNLINVLMIPIGKAAKAGHPTVRFSVDEVILWNAVS